MPLIKFCTDYFLIVFFVRNFSYFYFTMAKEKLKSPEPTKAELDVLRVLWAHGPQTVRFINDALNKTKRSVQYTSTLKLMQLMTEKGLLVRDESSVKHVYRPAQDEQNTKSLLLERFIDTLYNGSAGTLMMQLLGNKKTTKKDRERLRDLLNKIDKSGSD